MKTNLKTIASAAALMAALAGCSATGAEKAQPETAATPAAEAQAPAPTTPAQPATAQVDSIDGKKEVAYKCGHKGQSPLTVMYGFKDGQVVIAQVKYQEKLSPGLLRVLDDKDQNTFTANGITWTADKATPANVDKVNGNMLSQEAIKTVSGQQQQVSQIVTKYCTLDKAATAKLAKEAK